MKLDDVFREISKIGENFKLAPTDNMLQFAKKRYGLSEDDLIKLLMGQMDMFRKVKGDNLAGVKGIKLSPEESAFLLSSLMTFELGFITSQLREKEVN